MNVEQVQEADKSLRDLHTQLRGLQKDCSDNWYKHLKTLIFDALQSLPEQSKESVDKVIKDLQNHINVREYAIFEEQQRKRDQTARLARKFGGN